MWLTIANRRVSYQGYLAVLLWLFLFCLTFARISQSNKVNVTMCIMYERNTVGLMYDFNRVQAALDMALDYVNEAVAGPEMYFTAIYRDIGRLCPTPALTFAAHNALYLHDQGINCDMYLGPGCGSAAEALSDLAMTWDKPVIGLPSASIGLLTTEYYYDRLTRMSFTYPTLNSVITQFLDYFNYTTPVFFYDNSINFFLETGLLIRASLEQNYTSLFLSSPKLACVAYVLFILTNAAVTRRIMLLSRQLGMTRGDYVFVTLELYESDLWGHYIWENNDSYDEDAKEAYQALLIISFSVNSKADENSDRLKTFWNDVIESSQINYNYTFPVLDQTRPDPIVAHFYDAILLYGMSAHQMYTSNLSYKSGKAFTDFVSSKEYTSPLTGSYYLDENRERRSSYVIRSLDDRTQKHTAFLQFDAHSSAIIPAGAIAFCGHAGMPPSEPPCGFRNDNPVCNAERSKIPKAAIESAIAVPIVVFLSAFMVVCAYVIRRFLLGDSDPFWWRILLQDIVIDQNTSENDDSALVRSGQLLSLSISGTMVELPGPKRRIPVDILHTAALARALVHHNIQKFIGIAVNDNNQCDSIVGEICQRGTLRDLINDVSINLDWEFKSALIKDIINGMIYLHISKIRSHGFLNDQTCLIDNRFVLKICGYGFSSLRNENDLQALNLSPTEDRNYNILLWRAPELLRRTMPANGTQPGDVYSSSILLQQTILRSAPYRIGDGITAKEKKGSELNEVNDLDILRDVRRGLVPQLRPAVPISACPTALHDLMTDCWDEDSALRPPFTKVKLAVARAVGRAGENIVRHLIRSMEQYSMGLETQVEVKMKQLMDEQQRLREILTQMLPKSVADSLSLGIRIIPEVYHQTTIYFGKVAGFSEAVAECADALETVGLLTKLYSICDTVVAQFDVYKVEAINDAYMVASGVPVPNGSKHAQQLASMALGLRMEISHLYSVLDKTKKFELRAGLHSGSCVAGVIGLKLPKYCLFGDTVNTASRMEHHGEAGKIQISEQTKIILDECRDFLVIERGTINVKGKGPMLTYWLIGRK